MLKFTIGLPRSGKSTFCKMWEKYEDEETKKGCKYDTYHYSFPHRVVIAGDDFRNALYGKEFSRKGEGMVFAAMDISARALLFHGYDVIIDETATTEETIKRYLRIDINAIPVPINTPVEVCIERAISNNKLYLIPVINSMADRCNKLILDLDWRMEQLRNEVKTRQSLDVIV